MDVLQCTDILKFQGKVTRIAAQQVIEEFPGVLPSESWTVYEFHDLPGLTLIRNPFTAVGQRYWAVRCLRDFHRPPNPTNLSNLGRGSDDWWRDVQRAETASEHAKVRHSLRWATLGYHHNWDTKIYSEEAAGSFPDDLQRLVGRVLAPALGHADFRAQAAIVNYYPQGSTLSGHTDHSEVALEAPLFSLSLGQAAVFLVGGRLKSDAATAVLLRSGDVLAMAAESRLSYHAVPRILHGAQETWNAVERDGDEVEGELWAPFDAYLRDCRINVNVRQVLNKDQTKIP